MSVVLVCRVAVVPRWVSVAIGRTPFVVQVGGSNGCAAKKRRQARVTRRDLRGRRYPFGTVERRLEMLQAKRRTHRSERAIRHATGWLGSRRSSEADRRAR